MNKILIASIAGALIIFLALYIAFTDTESPELKEEIETERISHEEEREEISDENSLGEEPLEEASDDKITDDFIQCLKEEGVVIYGSTTCPACSRLEEKFGGYEVIEPIYLDCSRMGAEEEQSRCREEMEGMSVPETQIDGEVFKVGVLGPEDLAKETGCEL